MVLADDHSATERRLAGVVAVVLHTSGADATPVVGGFQFVPVVLLGLAAISFFPLRFDQHHWQISDLGEVTCSSNWSALGWVETLVIDTTAELPQELDQRGLTGAWLTDDFHEGVAFLVLPDLLGEQRAEPECERHKTLRTEALPDDVHPPQKFFDIDAADWLGYSSVVVSSVKKVSDNSALVIGLDVTYSENGKVVLMRPGADVAVNIAYVGKMERYDLVAYSLVTNGLVVRKGVERRTTAQEDLYRGKAQAGDIPLYSVYVIGGAIREVIKLWNWRGVRNKNTNAEQTAMYLENRRRLSRFLNKLHKSKAVIVTGYGDSNTALGGGHSSSADYLPNRPGVDTTPFQGPFMLSDLETDFRTAFLDTIGKVVLNGVTRYKAGPNWQVIDAICNSHGYIFVADRVPVAGEITYLNQGISASTSSAVGVYNGLYPDRLNAMINPAGFRTPDLVLLGFGMNDGTIESFVTTTSQLIQAIKAAGSDVFLIGPHWTNSNGIRFTESEWHLIHRRLSEVAEFHDVAYLPSELFYSGESRGYLGISDYSLTRTNWINHPGPYEYRMNGVAIAQYFK